MFAAAAGGNLEALAADAGKRLYRHRIDPRQWRRLRAQGGDEGIAIAALHFQQHALGIVQHPPAKPMLPRQLPHERPEADALNPAPNARTHTCGSTHHGR